MPRASKPLPGAVVTTSRDDTGRALPALAGIQYAGEAGLTKKCKQAVIRLIQCGEPITRALIVTCSDSHCLLLTVGVHDLVAIKSGFSSGYAGEGPTGFSYVLELLRAHGVPIEERHVAREVLERLDMSALTDSDLETIETYRPRGPSRWYEYIADFHEQLHEEGRLWNDFPDVVPFSVVDPRLMDLAISFWSAPDERLMTAYRRLEDVVRSRTGIDEHGAKLFSQAFLGPDAKLCWPGADGGEQAGRANLFVGAFGAFRNPRAHREPKENAEEQLAEFLMVNQLFRLERAAERKPAPIGLPVSGNLPRQ